MLWMAAFHFCFDLQYFGWLQADFYQDPFWTTQRTCIVSLFLLCAGAGQALAYENVVAWSRFFRRWAHIAGAALLVTAASYVIFPDSFIYFGVLHGMAVMLLLTRWLGRHLPWSGLLFLSVCVLMLPALAMEAHAACSKLSWLDSRYWNWLGWISHKPHTEDYVPLAPWLGVMLLGFLAGRVAVDRYAAVLSCPLPRLFQPLVGLGKHSLAFYLVHQPVLMGGMALVQWWAK